MEVLGFFSVEWVVESVGPFNVLPTYLSKSVFFFTFHSKDGDYMEVRRDGHGHALHMVIQKLPHLPTFNLLLFSPPLLFSPLSLSLSLSCRKASLQVE